MKMKELFDRGEFVVSAEVGPHWSHLYSNGVKPWKPGTGYVSQAAQTILSSRYSETVCTPTPLEYKCDQCGECYLNLTGGICPITACSKSLVNGQCGGSKNGKCEVDSEMECGWERIYRRLKEIGRLDALKCPTQIHNFATDDELKQIIMIGAMYNENERIIRPW